MSSSRHFNPALFSSASVGGLEIQEQDTSWRPAKAFRSNKDRTAVVLWYGGTAYEGLNAFPPYTITSTSSSSFDILFSGANGELRDGDGDIISTRFNEANRFFFDQPDENEIDEIAAPVVVQPVFVPALYSLASVEDLEVEEEDGSWRSAAVYVAKLVPHQGVIFYGTYIYFKIEYNQGEYVFSSSSLSNYELYMLYVIGSNPFSIVFFYINHCYSLLLSYKVVWNTKD